MSSATESRTETKTVKTVTSTSNGDKTSTSTSGGIKGSSSSSRTDVIKGSSSSSHTDGIKGSSSSSRTETSTSYSRRGPITATKTVVINRSLPGSVTTRDSVDSVQSSRVTRSYGAISSDFQHTTTELNNMLTGREKERRDMQNLNERFASYIEKVRFLEAQNKKLADELLQLRESWGKETEKVRSLYETELAQLRKLLEEADQYKAGMEVRVTSLEDQLNEVQILLDEANRLHTSDRETIDKLNQQMADYDSEISLLRRRVASFDEERSRDQNEIKRLRQDVTRLRGDLDTETLAHINAENCAQSLREELEFTRALHDSELKELAALVYRDTTTENREFWKNEMAQALHDIQREYDSKLDVVRSEVEAQYSIKVQEARTSSTRDNMELTHLKEENKRIKSQIGNARNRIPELETRNSQLERELEDLRREMEEAERKWELEKNQLRSDLSSCNATLTEYLKELQTLMDAKLSLELEILAYRRLLEGEEVRISQTSISREGSRTTTVIEEQTSQTSSSGGGQISEKQTSQTISGSSGGGGSQISEQQTNQTITTTTTNSSNSGGGGKISEQQTNSSSGGGSSQISEQQTNSSSGGGSSQISEQQTSQTITSQTSSSSGGGKISEQQTSSSSGGGSSQISEQQTSQTISSSGGGSKSSEQHTSQTTTTTTSSSKSSEQQKKQQQMQQIQQQQEEQDQQSTTSQEKVSIEKSEMTAKTSAQRTTKGNVTIQECDAQGKFVELEFTGKKTEDMSEWTLVRNVDNERMIVKYIFPKGTTMDTNNKTIKIWAKGERPADSKDLEMTEASWGMGTHIATRLSNADGEEKATHTLKTTYSTA